MKNILWFICAVLITSFALIYALWGVDFKELLNVFDNLNYVSILPFICLLLAFFWLKALRWALILRPIGRFTAWQVTPALMIGFAANNILPARLGELLRAVLFAQRFRKSYSGIFGSVALDRMLDVSAILAFYVFASLLLGDLPKAVQLGALVGIFVLAIAVVIIFLMLWRLRLVVSVWHRISCLLSDRYREMGEQVLHNVTESVSTLRSPRVTSLLIFNSLCQWCILTCNVWIAMWAFGVTISVGAAIFVMVVTALAVSVPSIPGYVGPIQAAFVFALGPFGIPQEVALAGSVFFLVAQWVPVTSVGVLFFISSGFRVREVAREADRIEKCRDSHEYEKNAL